MIKMCAAKWKGVRNFASKHSLGTLGGATFGGMAGALGPKDPEDTRAERIMKGLARGAVYGTAGSIAASKIKGDKSKVIARGLTGGTIAGASAYPSFRSKQKEQERKDRRIARYKRAIERYKAD